MNVFDLFVNVLSADHNLMVLSTESQGLSDLLQNVNVLQKGLSLWSADSQKMGSCRTGQICLTKACIVFKKLKKRKSCEFHPRCGQVTGCAGRIGGGHGTASWSQRQSGSVAAGPDCGRARAGGAGLRLLSRPVSPPP